jgi:hypothetical protein
MTDDERHAMGEHWRTTWKVVRGLGRVKVRQFGRYVWRQCWAGIRLRFQVIVEEVVS